MLLPALSPVPKRCNLRRAKKHAVSSPNAMIRLAMAATIYITGHSFRRGLAFIRSDCFVPGSSLNEKQQRS
jgi:hypothetical protein